ncbi:MAG: hypothetical protein O7G31_02690 [Calditrichaeota bacterium]|nr:hypothetical protein [Calditrichota bacterium]
MGKADYSIASQEEREAVIQILQRNANHIIEQKQTQKPEKLRQMVLSLCERIRSGDVITGKDFEVLIQFLQKRTVV